MELKSLIEQLSSLDPATVCSPGFCNPHSYRGYYERLAFEPCAEATVEDMLATAEGASGATYNGWKGGDFTMGDETLVHLADSGCLGEKMSPAFIARISGSNVPDEHEGGNGFIELYIDAKAIAAFVAWGALYGTGTARDKLAKIMLEEFGERS